MFMAQGYRQPTQRSRSEKNEAIDLIRQLTGDAAEASRLRRMKTLSLLLELTNRAISQAHREEIYEPY